MFVREFCQNREILQTESSLTRALVNETDNLRSMLDLLNNFIRAVLS